MIKVSYEELKANGNVKLMELVSALVKGPTHFTYTTKNGLTREANGTLNIDSVLTEDSENYDYLAKLFNLDEPVAVFNENDTDMEYFLYYDTDKKDIRQFNIHNIESIG